MLNDLYPLLRTVQPAELNTPSTRSPTRSRAAASRSARTSRRSTPTSSGSTRSSRVHREPPTQLAGLRHVRRRAARRSPRCCATRHHRHAPGPRGQLNALFDDVAGFSHTAQAFLDDNGDNMIRLADRAPSSRVSRATPRSSRASSGGIVAARSSPRPSATTRCTSILETLPNQPRGYGREGRAAVRRQPRSRTARPCRTRRGRQDNPAPHIPNSTTASTSPPARAPTASAPRRPSAPPTSRRRGPRRPALARSRCSRPVLGRPVDRGTRPRPPCCSGPSPAGRR